MTVAALVGFVGVLAPACSSSSSDSAATCQGKTGEQQKAATYGEGTPPDGTGKKIGMVFDVGGRGDKGFNDSAYNGLSAAAKNMKVDAKYLEPDAQGSNRGDLMRSLADDGYPMIIGVGFAFADDMAKIAKDYPDVKFAIVDGTVDLPNVTGLVFAEEQGSYLVGAAAAQATKAKRVGFIGGVESDLIKNFQAGYDAGVKKVDRDVTIDNKYISPEGDFSGFKDPAKGETIAKGLYSDGDDVIYHGAGLSGTGVFKAAAAQDRLVIGADNDQYFQVPANQQKCMLSSMTKRVDVAVYDAVSSYLNGSLKGGVQVGDLKNGGIDFATSGGQIPDVAQLNDLKQQIIDGKIKVPTTP
jgi:basic membrane protein A and related proteins